MSPNIKNKRKYLKSSPKVFAPSRLRIKGKDLWRMTNKQLSTTIPEEFPVLLLSIAPLYDDSFWRTWIWIFSEALAQQWQCFFCLLDVLESGGKHFQSYFRNGKFCFNLCYCRCFLIMEGKLEWHSWVEVSRRYSILYSVSGKKEKGKSIQLLYQEFWNSNLYNTLFKWNKEYLSVHKMKSLFLYKKQGWNDFSHDGVFSSFHCATVLLVIPFTKRLSLYSVALASHLVRLGMTLFDLCFESAVETNSLGEENHVMDRAGSHSIPEKSERIP